MYNLLKIPLTLQFPSMTGKLVLTQVTSKKRCFFFFFLKKKRSCVAFLIWRGGDVIGWWKPWEADLSSPGLEVAPWHSTFHTQSQPVLDQWF